MATSTEGNLFIDMLEREIRIPAKPQRIVSLVPSQTELLFDLGLEDSITGLTWFCIHPADKVKNIPKIGGTKNLNPDKIRAQRPDLIIANKEENERASIEVLSSEFPVWISDIATLKDAYEMIRQVGKITGTETLASTIADTIEVKFRTLPQAPPLRTLYLIWREPYMTVGNDTFIHHILSRCGLVNVRGDSTRYPQLNRESIKAINPELILLSSEPYPFGEKHIAELQLITPGARVLLVDGEMFSWYGSRLMKAAGYLEKLMHKLSQTKSYT